MKEFPCFKDFIPEQQLSSLCKKEGDISKELVQQLCYKIYEYKGIARKNELANELDRIIDRHINKTDSV